MRRIHLLSLFLAAPLLAEDAPQPWTHQLVGGVNLTQVALKDWAGGGEDALAWTLSFEGRSELGGGRFDWANTYRFAFGQTKLGDQGIRKTDDKIDLESVLTFRMGTIVNPYIGATFKSQFAKGFDYGGAGQVAISQFFDPAYLTQSAGVGYQPRKEIKTRLGLALREVVTRDFNSFSDDDDTQKTEKTKVDGGLESVTEGEWQVVENTVLKSKVEVFVPLAAVGETVLRNDNTIVLKVNDYLNVNLNIQLVSDETATTKTQVKEALAVGLSCAFL